MGVLLKKIASRLKKASRSENGQAIVEFAFVLPLLLIILMGILDFGWIYTNQYQVGKAASAAARYGTINVNRYKNRTTKQDYLDGIKDRAEDNLPDDADRVVCVDGLTTSYPYSENTAIVYVKVNRGDVTVTVEYPVKTLTFVAGALFGKYYSATSTCVSTY